MARGNFYGFQNRTFRVTTIEYAPFVWREQGGDGRVVYRGLVVCLLEAVAQHLNFRMSWHEPLDGQFGSTNTTGHWTGVVGDLVYGNADIAATGLTINSVRDEVIDYSVPFWEESIGVVVMSKQQSKLFAPLRPFSLWLWLSILASLLLVSAAMCMLGWLNERAGGRYNAGGSSVIVSVDCCVRAFLGQGAMWPVKSQSRRYVFASWITACVVFYGSYTASLTSELTVTELKTPFNTLHDMLSQTTYSFGAKEGAVSLLLMKTAPHGSIYNQMYRAIQRDPANIVPNTDVGFARVRSENYALIADETLLQMHAKDNCNLMLINERFYKSGYGLAFRENWPHKKYVDATIQQLVEGGLVEYWKKQSFPQLQCQKGAYAEAKIIMLEDTVGVFLLLAMGIAAAVCLIIMEKVYNGLMINCHNI